MTTMQKITAMRKRFHADNRTDSDLADHIGVNRATLSRWLSGDADPSLLSDTVRKVDEAFAGVVK